MQEAIERLQQAVNESEYIVFFGGAGVSTESGIPDFRSQDGLYSQKYKYPPETIVSHSFFMRKTEEFYDFYRDKMIFADAQPAPVSAMSFYKTPRVSGIVKIPGFPEAPDHLIRDLLLIAAPQQLLPEARAGIVALRKERPAFSQAFLLLLFSHCLLNDPYRRITPGSDALTPVCTPPAVARPTMQVSKQPPHYKPK